MTATRLRTLMDSGSAGLYGIREILDLAWGRSDVIRLEVGEPNFTAPEHAIDAAARASHDGKIRYMPNAGLPELREAMADKISRVNGYGPRPEAIVVTHGAVQGLFATVAAITQPGDELLIPDPGWPNFRMICSVLGVNAVLYPLRAEDGYALDLEAIEHKITARTRGILVNSPSNPLGTVVDRAALSNLIDACERHGLWLISDECYDEIVFDRSFTSAAAVADSEHIITVYSMSKTHAMTGWRVGYIVLPEELRRPVTRVQEPVISCVSAPSQYAALAVLQGSQDHVEQMVASYASNRATADAILEAADISHVFPAGAFYMWLMAEPGTDGHSVARELVTRHGVAVAPGPTFGPSGSNALRISLATDTASLSEGITRMVASGLLRAEGSAGLRGDQGQRLSRAQVDG